MENFLLLLQQTATVAGLSRFAVQCEPALNLHFSASERVEGQRSPVGDGEMFRHGVPDFRISSGLVDSRSARRPTRVSRQRPSSAKRFHRQNVEQDSGPDQVVTRM